MALRKGFEIQRRSTKNRLNAVCLFMKDDKIYTRQTHELSQHKVNELMALNITQILADDWETR